MGLCSAAVFRFTFLFRANDASRLLAGTSDEVTEQVNDAGAGFVIELVHVVRDSTTCLNTQA